MQEQTTELFCRPDTAAKEAPTLAATVPRILFTGVSSGCGKTTVTCAVLQALVNRGLRLHAFKCGPDYIDPMFHERVIGAAGSNLDLFFMTRIRCAICLPEMRRRRMFPFLRA